MSGRYIHCCGHRCELVTGCIRNAAPRDARHRRAEAHESTPEASVGTTPTGAAEAAPAATPAAVGTTPTAATAAATAATAASAPVAAGEAASTAAADMATATAAFANPDAPTADVGSDAAAFKHNVFADGWWVPIRCPHAGA